MGDIFITVGDLFAYGKNPEFVENLRALFAYPLDIAYLKRCLFRFSPLLDQDNSDHNIKIGVCINC